MANISLELGDRGTEVFYKSKTILYKFLYTCFISEFIVLATGLWRNNLFKKVFKTI